MSVYIVSAMLALVLAIVSKKLNVKWVALLLCIHLICLALFIIFKYVIASSSNFSAYSFLAFFCTGLILFGLIIRNKINILFKLYTCVFVFSILVFVAKPSRVLTFITQIEWPVEIEYKLADNLYLVKQDPLLKQTEGKHTYKISKKLGSFHRTLARNIDFKYDFDSVHVIRMDDKMIELSTYKKNNKNKSNQNIIIDLTKLKKRDNANIQ